MCSNMEFFFINHFSTHKRVHSQKKLSKYLDVPFESIVLEYVPLCECACHETPTFGCNRIKLNELVCENENSITCESCNIKNCKGTRCACGRVVCKYCVVGCAGQCTVYCKKSCSCTKCNAKGCYACFELCYYSPHTVCPNHNHEQNGDYSCRHKKNRLKNTREINRFQ